MNEENKSFEGFHKAMVNFVLWISAAGLVFVGARNLMYLFDDGVSPFVPILIAQIVLFGSAILLVKARFDLRNQNILGAKEILAAGLMAAAAFLYDWRVWEVNGELLESSFLFPLLAACWGIAIYRYYKLNEGKLG